MRRLLVLFLLSLFWCSATLALDVNITKDTPYVDVTHDGKNVRIQRIQDQDNSLTGGYSKTSRKCPPFCINPIKMAPNIATVGELELLTFMKTELKNGTGLIIDARTPEWYEKGTIPSSINIPFYIFSKKENDPELIATLTKLGVTKKIPQKKKEPGFLKNLLNKLFGEDEKKKPESQWDFSNAKQLVLWCNGIWCGQSPRAIRGLLKIGYPPEKLHWYRGGMQVWRILGLTVILPGGEVIGSPAGSETETTTDSK
jgi:rhodanese-related sulfurtransferase